MKIVLGADHGGWQMKEQVKDWLMDKILKQVQDDSAVVDVGATEKVEGDDYVDYAVEAVREIEKDDENRGVLFCRNGFGMVIAANRFKGVRCGLAFNVEAVRRGRVDDDINCLAIPADYVDLEQVKKMIEVFLKTKFSREERYERRLSRLVGLT